jgi:dipeptidyl aminopeptidase/acylaminoacyl peptidase
VTRARWLSLGVAAWLAALASPSCAGRVGVRQDELPAEPIAVFYREPEQARRRADQADQVGRYIAELFGAQERIEEREFQGRLALLDPRTRKLTVVAAALSGSAPVDWSPDHRRLLFAQLVAGLPQLFELDVESGEVRNITRGPAAHPEGCYGPDGRYVVVTARREGNHVLSQLELSNAGGVDLRPISAGPQDHSPTCAPDGSAVAWVANAGRVPQLVSRVPVADGEPRVLVPGRDPDFTPDSRWIVYSAPARGQWKLYRVRPDGGGRAPLGQEKLDEQQPAVSPDGRLVVYVNEVGFRASLFLRRFDGSGDRILFREGDATFPVW